VKDSTRVAMNREGWDYSEHERSVEQKRGDNLAFLDHSGDQIGVPVSTVPDGFWVAYVESVNTGHTEWKAAETKDEAVAKLTRSLSQTEF